MTKKKDKANEVIQGSAPDPGATDQGSAPDPGATDQGSAPDPGATDQEGDINLPEHDPGKPQEGRKIEFLVIHCSASNLPKHDNAATIDAWHKERGFKGIGYHFFIRHDGTLETGRPLDDDPILEREEIGAHTLGINKSSIGVCLSGIDSNDFTPAQFKTLSRLVETLEEKGIEFKIAGHNFFTDKKSCPNFDWREWVTDNFPEKLPE